MRKLPESDRFFEKVSKEPNGGCWLWTGCITKRGYGLFSSAERKPNGAPRLVLAHRWAYEHLRGQIPEGRQIDHLCRTRHCVNPSHMEAVTAKENVLRGAGLTAEKARQTLCKSGHMLSGANLRVDKRGYRSCIACATERNNQPRYKEIRRTYYQRHREEHLAKSKALMNGPRREELLARKRASYAKNRERILATRRAKRAKAVS